jgi:hypothetical protein
MHRAIGLGRIIQSGLFVDRQRVHVGAQADHLTRPGVAPLDDPHHACAADACHHFVAAERLQFFGNKSGCAVGFKQDLGVFVHVTAPCGDFILQLGKAVLYGHIVGS